MVFSNRYELHGNLNRVIFKGVNFYRNRLIYVWTPSINLTLISGFGISMVSGKRFLCISDIANAYSIVCSLMCLFLDVSLF